MLLTIAQWLAPAATMIAAMMTAANLGARVTGWGFVVFSIGAVAWIIDALASGQNNLLASNAFLLVVDLVGIWRWLGRQTSYDKGAEQASKRSARSAAPTLFPTSTITGKPVNDSAGTQIATVVDAMSGCADGGIEYLVVSRGGVGGVGETLHALRWDEVRIGPDAIATQVGADALERRPALEADCWPATADAIGSG